MTRILVTISRTWRQWSLVRSALADLTEQYPGATLVHGNHPKCDQVVAGMWKGTGGREEPHDALWETEGQRAAGQRRNRRMVESNPDVVIAFIRNGSNGASGTADLAERAGLRVIYYVDNDEGN